MKILILANFDMGLYKFRKELLEELVKEHEVYFCVPDGEYVDLIKNIGNNSNATKAVNAVKTVNTESTGNAGNTDDISNIENTSDISNIGCKFIPCNVLERRGTNPFKDLKLILLYWRAISKLKPDVVLTYTIKPNVYGGIVCQTRKVPYIANITGLGTTIENSGLLSFISIILYKFGLRKARCVFFQNKENRDFMLEHGVVKNNQDLLPGSGVNLEEYKVFPYPKCNTIDFVFIARIMKEKGIEQYLDAAKEIRKRHPETRFHICGFCEQDYEDRLEDLSNADIIVYHGVVSDMIAIYKMISCTIHPTYYPEGLSNVLLESCACGRPIITTDRPGCREIIEDGVNGYVVKQQDSHDLIEKIEKFLSLSVDERMKMGLAGRRKVEREFNRKIVINKYISEIKYLKIPESGGGGQKNKIYSASYCCVSLQDAA